MSEQDAERMRKLYAANHVGWASNGGGEDVSARHAGSRREDTTKTQQSPSLLAILPKDWLDYLTRVIAGEQVDPKKYANDSSNQDINIPHKQGRQRITSRMEAYQNYHGWDFKIFMQLDCDGVCPVDIQGSKQVTIEATRDFMLRVLSNGQKTSIKPVAVVGTGNICYYVAGLVNGRCWLSIISLNHDFPESYNCRVHITDFAGWNVLLHKIFNHQERGDLYRKLTILNRGSAIAVDAFFYVPPSWRSYLSNVIRGYQDNLHMFDTTEFNEFTDIIGKHVISIKTDPRTKNMKGFGVELVFQSSLHNAQPGDGFPTLNSTRKYLEGFFDKDQCFSVQYGEDGLQLVGLADQYYWLGIIHFQKRGLSSFSCHLELSRTESRDYVLARIPKEYSTKLASIEASVQGRKGSRQTFPPINRGTCICANCNKVIIQ